MISAAGLGPDHKKRFIALYSFVDEGHYTRHNITGETDGPGQFKLFEVSKQQSIGVSIETLLPETYP